MTRLPEQAHNPVSSVPSSGFDDVLSALDLRPASDVSAEARALMLDHVARRFSELLKSGSDEGVASRRLAILAEKVRLEGLVLLSLPPAGLAAAWEEELAAVAQNTRAYQDTLAEHNGFRELQELVVHSTLGSKIGIQNHSGSGSAWMIRAPDKMHFFTCIADNYGLEVSKANLRESDGAVVSTGQIQYKFPYARLGLRPQGQIRSMTIPASHLARWSLIRETFLTERQAGVVLSQGKKA